MIKHKFITNGIKILIISALLISSDLIAFSNFSKTSNSGYYNALADDDLIGGEVVAFGNWDAIIEKKSINLFDDKIHSIFAHGEAFANRSGELKKIENKYPCLVIEQVENDKDGIFFISFSARPVTILEDSIGKDIHHCYFGSNNPAPISKKGKVLVEFDDGDDAMQIDYFTNFKMLSFGHNRKKEFISLLKNNKNETISFSFPVDSYQDVDYIEIKFDSDNLESVLSEIGIK